MERSENIGDLAGALAKAQGAIKGAAKGKENPFYKSSYADLACVMEACREALSKNAIAVIQSTQFDGDGKWIETILAHSSGQWISSRYPVKPVKDDPQGLGSAVTYARRYSLMALVGIVAEDEDDDGNMASGKTAGNSSTAPEPAKRPVAPKPTEEAKRWAKDAEAAVRGCGTLTELRAWETKNDPALQRLSKLDTTLFDGVMGVLADTYERLTVSTASA
jgi:hypothetical protein